MDDRYVLDGFTFQNEEELNLAKEEKKKIAYIESKVNYRDINAILTLYNKLINDSVFKTPIGLMYMKRMYDYLDTKRELFDGELNPLPAELTRIGRKRLGQAELDSVADGEKKESIVPLVSIILNILLVIAIIAMFIITLSADRPNILNYERVLTDQYSSWEQDLREREKVVKEKEQMLLRGEE